MICPLRQFPLFNFITLIVKGVSIILPQIEENIKIIIKPSSQT